jgi:hypothetical protein
MAMEMEVVEMEEETGDLEQREAVAVVPAVPGGARPQDRPEKALANPRTAMAQSRDLQVPDSETVAPS